MESDEDEKHLNTFFINKFNDLVTKFYYFNVKKINLKY